MWFNSTISEEPHQGLTSGCISWKQESLRGCLTDAAWLSSARVVRCTVKSENERNPYPVFYMSQETARFKWEEGGMTSNQHGSYTLGNTCATMGITKGRQTVRWSQSLKSSLSSDWGLQLDLMKPESLVIVDQLCHGEYVLGSCTHKICAGQVNFLSG